MLTTIVRQSGAAVRFLLVMTVLLGVLYPLAVWGVSRLPGLSGPAEGSLLHAADGTVVGSSLIGLDPVAGAADPWFHTRPSATAEDELGLGSGDPSTSAGTNLGGFDEGLLDTVAARREVIAAREGVAPGQVPVDAVSSSASGIDPGISPAYAQLQVPRVARVTGLPVERVEALVAEHTQGRVLGFLGEPQVNVTTLNRAVLDRSAAGGGQ